MPTKKKRVGFIPREDVMKIIEKLSIENNLSNSKIISSLVEEALSIRGIFNKKNGKATKQYLENNNHSKIFNDKSAEYLENGEFSIESKLLNHFNLTNKDNSTEANQEDFELQTYKNFLSFLKFKEMMDKYNTK